MVNYNLIASIGTVEDDAQSMIREALGTAVADGQMDSLLEGEIQSFTRGAILKGKIVGKAGDDYVVEVGLKSEGLINKTEFDTPDDVEIGDTVEVLLEELEDEQGTIKLSKRKADRIRGWERILETKKEGDVVEGKCIRKIKGGLLVDIGVPVFLPASQVDIRRPGEISDWIGRSIDAVTTAPPEWRADAIPPAMSIHCMRMPPKIVPCVFVRPGRTSWAVSTREARGVFFAGMS